LSLKADVYGGIRSLDVEGVRDGFVISFVTTQVSAVDRHKLSKERIYII